VARLCRKQRGAYKKRQYRTLCGTLSFGTRIVTSRDAYPVQTSVVCPNKIQRIFLPQEQNATLNHGSSRASEVRKRRRSALNAVPNVATASRLRKRVDKTATSSRRANHIERGSRYTTRADNRRSENEMFAGLYGAADTERTARLRCAGNTGAVEVLFRAETPRSARYAPAPMRAQNNVVAH